MIEGQLQLKLGNFALDSGPFSFATQGITVLFGRSGSGKSTLLRAITGLDARTRGTLRFKDERWQDDRWSLPPPQRNIGFVFQDAALFPHLNVRGNLHYALQRAPVQAADALVNMAQRVGIEHLLDQSVTTLSGGERQRVAIARALLCKPRLLCMDEPLAALDWRAKAELLTLIDALALEAGVPIIYITHAPIEVERLASRVLFMASGRIERIETLHEALSRPDSPLFAQEGPVTVLHGELSAPDADGLMRFTSGPVQLRLTPGLGDSSQGTLRATRLRVLARDVSLALLEPQGLSILNQLPMTIAALHPDQQGRVTVTCRLRNGDNLLAEITRYSCERLALQVGSSGFALIKSVALMD